MQQRQILDFRATNESNGKRQYKQGQTLSHDKMTAFKKKNQQAHVVEPFPDGTTI